MLVVVCERVCEREKGRGTGDKNDTHNARVPRCVAVHAARVVVQLNSFISPFSWSLDPYPDTRGSTSPEHRRTLFSPRPSVDKRIGLVADL